MTLSADPGIGRRITRYGTLLSVSGMVCKLMLLVYTVYAVDILGKEGFGRIEYFIEMAIIFSVLLDFGLEQTYTREVARRRRELAASLYPLLIYRALVSLAGGLVMGAFLGLTAQPGHSGALILSTISYFFSVSLMMLLRAYARSYEWLGVEGIANVLDKAVHIGLAFCALFWLPSLPLIVLCYTAGALTSLLIYLLVMIRNRPHRQASPPVDAASAGGSPKSFQWRQCWHWQRMALPLGLSAACILLLHRQDTVMVNWIRGDEETGLYRAPYRFLEGLFLFPQVMAISAYPVFSKLFHENRIFAKTAADLLLGLFLISLPIATGGLYVSEGLMLFLTPELGRDGGAIFQILLWSLPFIYANFLLGTILNATDRQTLNLRASACGLICNAVLNIPAIAYFGAYGASGVTVLSQGLYTLLILIYLRDFRPLQGIRRYAAAAASCAIMLGALWLLPVRWPAAIPLGAVIYTVSVVLLGGIHRRDIENMLKVIRRS